MKALDTNVLARFFIDDADDAQAAKQRPAAVAALHERSFVSVTVLLELEWVMRGYYAFEPAQVLSVMRHLLSIPHLTVEDRSAVEQAVAHCEAGLDFADALHYASYRTNCAKVASFDDRKFSRRAKTLGLSPAVILPD